MSERTINKETATSQSTSSQRAQEPIDRNDPENKLVYNPITRQTYDPVTNKLSDAPELTDDAKYPSSDDQSLVKDGKEDKKKLTMKEKIKKYAHQGINSVAQPGSTNWSKTTSFDEPVFVKHSNHCFEPSTKTRKFPSRLQEVLVKR
ncbi:hypothetical protein N0V90_005804 [Kalmusia sp. IMI 367209]|nr:hypothetical protein N0V90_005804 [Kalmusia sp. IMI 367209]